MKNAINGCWRKRNRYSRRCCRIGVLALLQLSTFAIVQSPAITLGADSCDGAELVSSNECCGCPVDIEYGNRRPFIDGLGWIVGIPEKILYWDRRADNHDVSRQTVDQISSYIQSRKLTDTKVRVNQYDPVGEWNRLVDNRRIAPGWKYTLGTLRQIRYIVLPGRIFGGDDYNPFTNTVSIYSDLPAIGMAEAAYAKDVRSRRYPGTYAAVQSLPLVAIWHETLATDDVMTYVSIRGSLEQQKQVRRILFVRYGMSLGTQVSDVLPDGSSVFRVAGALAGHTGASIANH